MKSYNFAKDIKSIRKVFDLTQTTFSKEIGLSRSNIVRYEKEEIIPHKNALEKVYSYCFNNGFNINRAKEMLFDDNKQSNILLFHGAKDTISGDINPSHLNGTKDFGAGFYLSESFDSAAMWVADRDNGSCYCFYSNSKNLKTITYKVDKKWMYAILYYRGHFRNYELTDDIIDIVKQIEECDLVIAPIADNNMYETLTAFAYNQISDEQCLHALSANNLGLQYVFKSKKGCDSLEFVDRLYLCEKEKTELLTNKKALALNGRSKVNLVINEYRRKGKYFDELFKKNG